MFKQALQQAANDYGLVLSEQQLGQFTKYYELLVEWNQKINLTAITEPGEAAVKHMIDSLSAWNPELFAEDASLVDVGTGAGFPGIPLRIMHPGLRLTLLDSLNKRVRYLQTVVDALGLTGVRCVHARAEEAARQKEYREQFDIAVSRAVARLPVLAEYCLPFVKKGGVFAALKGMQYEQEVAEAMPALGMLGGRLQQVQPVRLPGLDDVRAVIYVKKTAATAAAYPRKAGTPEKNPLGVPAKKEIGTPKQK